jgi:ADP-heptose:LPS heptosyltransferase
MIRLGAIGDVVRTLPALVALRAGYPNAHISWLAEQKAAAVLNGHDALDQVLLFPREALSAALTGRRPGELRRTLNDFVKTLRAERFDLVIDFHAILKSGIISRLSGAPVRVSYAWPDGREFSWLFANRRAQLSPGKRSRYDRNAGLLEFLTLDPQVRDPVIKVDPAARQRMDRAGLSRTASVLLHPGTSSNASHKRYRPSGYAALARELKRSRGLDSIVSVGTTTEERALADRVVAASDGAARLAPETPELADLTALIERVLLFVGSDSGPLHIATAVGTPAVQILGPTDPVENEPRSGTHWERVRIEVPCSPCRRGCGPATCMSIIPHELILDAVLTCLDKSTETRGAHSVRRFQTAPMAIASQWS